MVTAAYNSSDIMDATAVSGDGQQHGGRGADVDAANDDGPVTEEAVDDDQGKDKIADDKEGVKEEEEEEEEDEDTEAHGTPSDERLSGALRVAAQGGDLAAVERALAAGIKVDHPFQVSSR